MKKKLILVAVAAIVAAAAVFTICSIHEAGEMDSLFDSNVDALARMEGKNDGAYWSSPDGKTYCCGQGNVRDCDEGNVPRCKN